MYETILQKNKKEINFFKLNELFYTHLFKSV